MALVQKQNILPMLFIILLLTFIPICIIFTLNITSSMMRYSKLYNEKAMKMQLYISNYTVGLRLCIEYNIDGCI